MIYAVYGIIAYLLGSVPFGLLISKAKGIDIREHGSGNIGATNVVRVLGWKWGLPVFILDILKGFLPTYYVWNYTDADFYIAIIVGILAILGHIFPVYLKFKGGKGVATGLGVFLGLSPLPTLGAVLIFVIMFLLTGYVSVGSLSAAFSLPIWILIYNYVKGEFYAYPLYFVFVAILVSAFVFYTHRKNIKRLLNGEEMRILYKNKGKGNE